MVADLAVNFVERQFLLAGHTVQRDDSDYGIDLVVRTFDLSGVIENGTIHVQVKGTDAIRIVDAGRAVAQQLEVAHLNHWLYEPMPVIVVLYDAIADQAYWEHVQSHFADLAGFVSPKLANYKTMRIPTVNRLGVAAVGVIQKIDRNGVRW